ncbi:transposon-transfer assisting family protein [Lacrimispora xylanisolvens]|uniref:transposon-transfer assisting family protein n=1 Tax=Lacrimispora xylanisolvens TaxID=384636 RepID=UPI002402A7B3
MMDRFEENEMILMAMFQKENRRQTIVDISAVIPFISDDVEMLSLVSQTLGKMEHLSDEAFLKLDLELYKEQIVEEQS